jgi:PAS domain S-box-containing protein
MPPVLAEMGQAAALIALDDGRLLYTNRACERLFAFAEGGLVDRHLSEVTAVAVHSPGDHAAAMRRAIDTKGVWSGHTEGIRRDGTTFPCVASLSEIDDPSTGDRVWIAVFTELGRPPAADAPSPPFQVVFDEAAVPLAVVGSDLRIVEGNRALLQLLGRRHHELVGKPVSELIHPELVSEQLEQLRHLLEGGIGELRGETKLFAADHGAIPVRLTAALVRDFDQRPLSALLVLDRLR